MITQRWRPLFFSVLALLAIWLVALAGYRLAKNSRMTAERVRSYVESVDLSKLSGAARARAIAKLAEMLNALSLEERRRARLERVTGQWFEQMSEEEKGAFIEA